jgi:hypothetical protein
MIAAVRAEHLLEVTAAAADRDRAHPLLGCELGGPYDRFRAVHDIVGHVIPRFGFDRDAELLRRARRGVSPSTRAPTR